MTVKELISILKKYDENLIVCRDYEGCYRDIDENDFYIVEKSLYISKDE